VGIQADAILPHYSARVAIHVQALEQSLSTIRQWPETRNISVPTAVIANTFLDAYATHLDAVQHVLHVETTRKVIAHMYARHETGQELDPGALCLVLAICASVAYYYTQGSSSGEAIFTDVDTAHKVAVHLAKHGLYAMEQVQMATTAEPTLEAIQGTVLLSFLFYHMEGFTFRVRCMHSFAITMARCLGLHRTDAGDAQTPSTQLVDVIDREVRRKVWWHLTCTDWLFAFVGGPRKNPRYNIRVESMSVRIPRNLNQDDLATHDQNFSRPVEQPTSMAYYLQRIKIATTCREVVDMLWSSTQLQDPAEVDYDIVRALDAKIEAQLNGLPSFLRLDLPSSQLRAKFGDMFTQSLDAQRSMVHLAIHGRRCQLHMPFLIRFKSNRLFEPSRAIGLQSARAVLETRLFVLNDTESFGAARVRLGAMLQVGRPICRRSALADYYLHSTSSMPSSYWSWTCA
jgi:hypothetical protein